MDPTQFGGLERVLDNLDSKIDEVAAELRSLDEKVDLFLFRAVTKDEFNAYRDLRQAIDAEAKRTRRSNIQWAIGTFIAVLMLMIAAVSVIITSRPDLELSLSWLGHIF